jgi:hypothetical protein
MPLDAICAKIEAEGRRAGFEYVKNGIRRRLSTMSRGELLAAASGELIAYTTSGRTRAVYDGMDRDYAVQWLREDLQDKAGMSTGRWLALRAAYVAERLARLRDRATARELGRAA